MQNYKQAEELQFDISRFQKVKSPRRTRERTNSKGSPDRKSESVASSPHLKRENTPFDAESQFQQLNSSRLSNEDYFKSFLQITSRSN